jgi:putative glutamine amidotransferase
MRPRIAIPLPNSTDFKYDERSLPQYEQSIERFGGAPVRIPLDQPDSAVRELIAECDGVLLPGSPADVDPAKYQAERNPKTAIADPPRDRIDSLLLEDAYRDRKPVFGICYGLQSLNVFRNGSLVQHIESPVPHEAGGKVPIAHNVVVEPASRLAKILADAGANPADLPVNSSHHQSAERPGEGLRIVSHCPQDGIVEAMEGTAPNHFVLAVQWHPERSVDLDAASGALFREFIAAAKARKEERVSLAPAR